MNWCLKSGAWCLFLVPSAVLTASISPSYAEVSNSSLLPIELPNQILAQAPNPDGDRHLERFVQPTSIPEQLTPKPEERLQVTTPENPDTPTATSASFEVKKIEVKGSTIFNSEQLSKLTRPVEGKIASLEEIRQVADAIT